jgi:PAS domain S-box-containing protein
MESRANLVVASRIGVATIAVGALVLVGWNLDAPVLKSIVPGLVPMKANTALAFILLGTALWLRARAPSHSAFQWLTAFALVIAVATLVEFAVPLPFAIDELLLSEPIPMPATNAAGRMGMLTAFCLGLSAIALLFSNGSRHARDWSQLLAIGSASLAAAALVGHAFSVRSPPDLGPSIQMAIHSAGTLFALGLGIAAVTADGGVAAIVTSRGPGGMFARSIVPVVLLGLLAVGWIRLAGQRMGLYGTEFGVAIFVITSAAMLSAMVLFYASRIDRFERGRRAADERMRFTLAAARMGAWEVDLASGQLTWSDTMAALFGLRLDQAPRTRAAFFEMVHPDDRPGLAEAVQKAMEGKGDYGVEFRAFMPDGSTRWIFARALVTFAPERTPMGLTGVALDLTERKTLEHQLHQSQKLEAIGQLAGGVAHDFNNVLTAIIGYSELLMLETDDPNTRRDLEEIRRAGNRATAITQQLLAFGRRQLLQPEVVDVNVLVGELETMLRRLVPAHVQIDVRLDRRGGCCVKADPTQIEQILMNLVVNARDAMPKGGTVTVETSSTTIDGSTAHPGSPIEAGDYVQLTVRDTGAGMDPETKERVFEPFFTTKGPGKGTGLGLATVYGIIKQSGGHVWLDSEPGHGTTFTIFLPRVDDRAPDGGSRAAKAGRGGSETVLVVEDEPGVRSLARRILEHRGYHVLEAKDPIDGLGVGHAYADRIHLLLSDVVMPGSGTMSLYDELAPSRPDMRVLYMSGYADETVVAQGVLSHGAPLLKKPFTARALADAVRDAIDRPA